MPDPGCPTTATNGQWRLTTLEHDKNSNEPVFLIDSVQTRNQKQYKMCRMNVTRYRLQPTFLRALS